MSRIVRITESDLRGAIADERYWRVGHPERDAFQNWVGQGFRGLNPSDGEARSTVWVRAYMRGGHWVSAHFRRAPPHHQRYIQYVSFRVPDVGGGLIPTPVQRGPMRPRQPSRSTGGAQPGIEATPARRGTQRERREGSDGRDRVEELRRDAETQHQGVLRNQIDQWDRPGGTSGRDADLRMLGASPPDVMANGALRYLLPNGSIATARRSTTPNAGSELTLEIAHPAETEGRFIRTDKFRYPDMVRSQRP